MTIPSFFTGYTNQVKQDAHQSDADVRAHYPFIFVVLRNPALQSHSLWPHINSWQYLAEDALKVMKDSLKAQETNSSIITHHFTQICRAKTEDLSAAIDGEHICSIETRLPTAEIITQIERELKYNKEHYS